jgi:hypothetical protein
MHENREISCTPWSHDQGWNGLQKCPRVSRPSRLPTDSPRWNVVTDKPLPECKLVAPRVDLGVFLNFGKERVKAGIAVQGFQIGVVFHTLCCSSG